MIIVKTSSESNNYENFNFFVRNIQKMTIPDFIKHIDSFSFAQLFIVYISIPDNVEVIGKSAFSHCERLQYVVISK